MAKPSEEVVVSEDSWAQFTARASDRAERMIKLQEREIERLKAEPERIMAEIRALMAEYQLAAQRSIAMGALEAASQRAAGLGELLKRLGEER